MHFTLFILSYAWCIWDTVGMGKVAEHGWSIEGLYQFYVKLKTVSLQEIAFHPSWGPLACKWWLAYILHWGICRSDGNPYLPCVLVQCQLLVGNFGDELGLLISVGIAFLVGGKGRVGGGQLELWMKRNSGVASHPSFSRKCLGACYITHQNQNR